MFVGNISYSKNCSSYYRLHLYYKYVYRQRFSCYIYLKKSLYYDCLNCGICYAGDLSTTYDCWSLMHRATEYAEGGYAEPRPGPKPGPAEPVFRLLARPTFLSSLSPSRPGLSRGIWAKPEPSHHYTRRSGGIRPHQICLMAHISWARHPIRTERLARETRNI